MTDEKLTEFQGELKVVSEKFGIKNGAFCGFSGDRFIGTSISPVQTRTEAFEVALAVGRLWQHMRTSVRDILAEYEK